MPVRQGPPARVREVRPDEFAEAGRVTVDAYAEFAEAFGAEAWEHYSGHLADVASRAQKARILVAEDGGGIAGAVAYYPPRTAEEAEEARAEGRTPWPAGWARVGALAVHPTRRSRGIGRQLVEACIEQARADGARAIGLHTTSVMTVAQTMYERMGFRRIPEFDHQGSRVHVPAYVLPL